MEIGVYNGENALSMMKAAIKVHPVKETEYYGFDFFNYFPVEQISRKLDSLGCNYRLFKGNTLETFPEAVKSLPYMDMIFIDGGKSFEIAYNDWDCSSRLMHSFTGVFIYNVGFSGVRRMVDNISRKFYLVEIFSPESEGKVALIKRKLTN
jgi:predicted O-methyltransferase YrrM